LTYDARGNLLRSVNQVKLQEQIRVRLGEGTLHCEVLEKGE
jgi:exodeoxyribonuclease VII large subunit